MHTDKVFYSNAQIKKADWVLAFRTRGEKSAAALLDKPSGKSAERSLIKSVSCISISP
jgi:hypothetical protein